MPRYAVFRLFHPSLARSLRDGHYDLVENVGTIREPIPPGTRYIDRETGAIHAADEESGGDLFSVLGLADLRDRLIEPTFDLALDRYDPERVPDLVTRLLPDATVSRHTEKTLVIEGLTREGLIGLCVGILEMMAQHNADLSLREIEAGLAKRFYEVVGAFSLLTITPIMVGQRYRIDYTNFEGRRSVREIKVTGLSYGANSYHTTPGLIVEAIDVARNVLRTFTTDTRARIHAMIPVADEPA